MYSPYSTSLTLLLPSYCALNVQILKKLFTIFISIFCTRFKRFVCSQSFGFISNHISRDGLRLLDVGLSFESCQHPGFFSPISTNVMQCFNENYNSSHITNSVSEIGKPDLVKLGFALAGKDQSTRPNCLFCIPTDCEDQTYKGQKVFSLIKVQWVGIFLVDLDLILYLTRSTGLYLYSSWYLVYLVLLLVQLC